MSFKCLNANILSLHADALVMPANTHPICGSGLDYKIYSLANPTKLLKARKEIGEIEIGDSKITDSYSLSSQFKFIIHTVSPEYHDGKYNEAQLLESCYESALELAVKKECKSIVFPLLSTGIFHFPVFDALTIAHTTCVKFSIKNDIDITLVVYDREAVNIAQHFHNSIEDYIFSNTYDGFDYNRYQQAEQYIKTISGYTEMHENFFFLKQKFARKQSDESRYETFQQNNTINSLNIDIGRLSFSTTYEQLKSTYGNPKDAEVCRRININQKILTNMKSGASCTRDRLWQFCIALHLNLVDAEKLFQSADKFIYCDYKLSPDGAKREKAFEFFLNNKIYDIGEIDDQLSQLNLLPLFPPEN